jgi:hypothetical protein
MTQRLVIIIEGKESEWGADVVTLSEAEAVEREFGGTWDSFCIALDAGSQRARRVLVWSILLRDDPNLQIGEVNLTIGAVKIETRCNDCNRQVGMLPGQKGFRHLDTEREECGEATEEVEPEVGPTSPGVTASDGPTDASPSDELAMSSTPPTFSTFGPGSGRF